MNREGARNGFATLDLLPYFAQWQPADLKLGPDDMLHPNELGNEIAAAAIYRALVCDLEPLIGIVAAPWCG